MDLITLHLDEESLVLLLLARHRLLARDLHITVPIHRRTLRFAEACGSGIFFSISLITILRLNRNRHYDSNCFASFSPFNNFSTMSLFFAITCVLFSRRFRWPLQNEHSMSIHTASALQD